MEKNMDEVIETPSSYDFSKLTDKEKENIKNIICDWRKASSSGGKLDITNAFKKKYKGNDLAIAYFNALKNAKENDNVEIKSRKAHKPEAIAREEFTIVLKDFMKKYFKNNCFIDHDSRIFLLDCNYNLPPYFWMRMNTNVLPTILSLGPDKKILKLRAWQLAKGIMLKHEQELGDRLQKTKFTDLRHVSHTIIQFLNKYMLTTYKELMEKARQQVINQKKNEKKIKEEEQNNIKENTIKKRGGVKGVQKVNFDTTGLL